MRKAAIIVLSSLFLSFAFASSVMAGNFGWEVIGPSQVMQGHSINLTLNVTAMGSLHIDHPDPVFTVNTSYTIGTGSGVPTELSGFIRSAQFNPGGKQLPDAVSGSASTTLTLSALAGLTPGIYTVTITPSATQGMTLDPISLTYQVTVTPATLKPIVTINTPLSGSEWLYDTTIDISVSVNDQGSPIFDNSVVARLDGGEPILLTLDIENNTWEGYILGDLGLGPHTLTVSATNAAGTGTETATLSVYVNFGTWLPPISLGKTQKGGSTLPVKFTLLGALGPVAAAYPHVLMDGVDLGEASVNYDSGVPFYQFDAKVPSSVTPHMVSVEAPNMKPASIGKSITVK